VKLTFCCKFQLGLSTWILNKAVVKLDAEKCQNMVPFPFNHLGFPSSFLGRYYLRYQSLQPCFVAPLVTIPRPACEGQSQLHDPAQQVVLLARAARETRTTLWSALQATQLVELDREVATGLRKLDEESSREEQQSKVEEIDTEGNTDQETKKEIPND
jgi:hypothetical protein